MPKYRVLLQTIEVNTYEVVVESDREPISSDLADLALDAFFGRDLPEGKRATLWFNVDGETLEGPDVVEAEEVKE